MINIIAVPYHLGERAVSVGAGPLRLLESGLIDAKTCTVSILDVGARTSWELVNAGLTSSLARIVAAGDSPLILAGNCNSCLGTLAALQGRGPGILWFDAHGDFHTPETSISGSIEGMSLAIATERYVQEDRVILAGARDLDTGEAERVHDRLHYISQENLPLQTLPDFAPWYVHVDVDVLDSAISPGVNFHGPGGITPQQLFDSLQFTLRESDVAALAITNYNPDHDSDNRTRDIIIEIIQAICDLRTTGASR